MHRATITAFLAGCCLSAASAQSFESAETPATLLELFTSEGCSSCPPADQWISRLKNNGDLWKKIVPVVYHVDYWDRLGWRDRFAKREFTERQQHYAAIWRNESVYTPAFVANGREWRDWSDAGKLPANSATRPGKLQLSVDDRNQVSARFTPVTTPNESLQLHVALLGSNLESDVARGENSGRKLHHDFVALVTAQTNLVRKDDGYVAALTLPNEQLAGKPAAVAAWITDGEAKPPLQATGGWLKQ